MSNFWGIPEEVLVHGYACSDQRLGKNGSLCDFLFDTGSRKIAVHAIRRNFSIDSLVNNK